MYRRQPELHVGAVILRRTARKAEISNWISDGTMEAPTRTGTKEKGPAASSAPSATASAHARFRTVRRFTGAAESTGYCLLVLASWCCEPERDRGGAIPWDDGMPVDQGSTPGPFGLLFSFLVTTGRGP